MTVTLTPSGTFDPNRYGLWLRGVDWPIIEEDIDRSIKLDVVCACGGEIIVLVKIYMQRPIVCLKCRGVFYDNDLKSWSDAGSPRR